MQNDTLPQTPTTPPDDRLSDFQASPRPTPTIPPVVVSPAPQIVPIADKQRFDSRQNLKNTISSIIMLIMAPLLAIFLTLFVFQSYQVDGPSMETTLFNADRLIVWKAPRTFARISGHQYVPNRGDVIIFRESGLGTYGDSANSKQLVKRVIGLPGEHVTIKNGSINVYNQDHPSGFDPDKTLPYGKERTMPETLDEIDVTLASNELFVCGDNRPNSLDSRMFGPIKTDQVVGKLVVRISPLSQAKLF